MNAAGWQKQRKSQKRSRAKSMDGQISELMLFDFRGNQVRMVGTIEVPEWIAQDVCSVLEISDTSNALRALEGYQKGTHNVRTPGGEQEMLTVTEAGLYSLIFKSRKKVAKEFRRWVFQEVLPQIRKTGSYQQPSEPPQQLPPAKERLEDIEHGMNLFDRLGGCDERTELALRDLIRNILFEANLQGPLLPSSDRAEWPISDRAGYLGYHPKRADLIRIGKEASKLYHTKYGQRPPLREQYVDGTTRMVRSYGTQDLDILDQAIETIMGQADGLVG